MNPQPGPNLTAFLSTAHTAGLNLPATVDIAIAGALNREFTAAVAEQRLTQWRTDHAGKSLVAYLGDDGTIAAIHEMSNRDAATLANEQPDRTLVITTWPEVTP